MRLRNVKNKEEIMNQSNCLIRDPFPYKGKWNEYFHNNHPIYVEIGMGKGKFLVENALKHPEINYIGIEKYDSVIVKAVQRVEEDIPNIVFIRGDANRIDEMFLHEIDKIYLNFSDPWPKKRHHLRRLSSSVFLEKYDSIFKNTKDIEMRTDNLDLYEYSLESFLEGGYSFLEKSSNLHKDHMPEVTTEYEDKFSDLDMPIYYVHCQKD